MDTVVKKTKTVFAVFLAIIFFFSHNFCYASYREKVVLTTGVVLLGVGWLAFDFLTKRNKDESFVILVDKQLPVIMSSSNSNLLSLNNEPTTGKIIVKNLYDGDESIEGFTIKIKEDPTGSVFVDPNSSCFGVVPAGGLCEFNVTYTGSGSSETRDPVIIEVGNDPETSDFITMNAINMPLDTFFVPDLDSTTAKDFNVTGRIYSFASSNKNGVDILYVSSNGYGIYKSTDNGVNWIPVNNGLTDKQILALYSIEDGSSAGIYAGVGDKVFKTVNGGANWVELSGSSLAEKGVWVIYAIGDDLYVGTQDDGVFKRNDSDTDWDEFNDGLTHKMIRDLHAIGSNLYAYTQGGVFVIDTSVPGSGWESFNDGLPTIIGLSNFNSLCSINNDLYMVMPGQGSGGGGVFKRAEGSSSWVAFSNGMSEIDKDWAWTIHSVGEGLYVGVFDSNASGVLKIDTSASSPSWTAFNNGLTSKRVYSLYSIGDDLYVGQYGGKVFKDAGATNNWELLNTGLTSRNIKSSLSVGSDLYVGTSGGGVFKSIDGGINWLPSGLSGYTVYDIYSVAAGSNIGLYAGTNSGVFKSGDWGAAWSPTALTAGTIYAIHSIDSGSNIGLYAGSNEVVYKSVDGGSVWNASSLSGGGEAYALASVGDNLIAATPEGIYRSTNGASSWWSPMLSADSFYALYFTGSVLYAGGSGWANVYKSTNGGSSWSATSGQPPSRVIALHSIGGDLYASTYYDGLYKTTDGGSNWLEVLPKRVQALTSIDSGVNIGLYAGTNNDGVYKSVTSSP